MKSNRVQEKRMNKGYIKPDTLRVLHVVPSPNIGGIERGLLRLLRDVDRTVCRMDFCCRAKTAGAFGTAAEELGAEVFCNPLRPFHVGFVSRLGRMIEHGNYVILHNHLGIYSGAAVLAARQAGIPVVSTFHGTQHIPEAKWLKMPGIREAMSVYTRLSIDYAIRKSDSVTAVSNGALDSLTSADSQVRKKSAVVHFGVNIPDLPTEEQKSSFRISFGWPADTPLIIHVGIFREAKNHRGLFQIFKRILKQEPRAKLLVVGDGPERESVEAAIGELGIYHAVKLLGFRDDVDYLLTHCDLFLFPSIREGFGLAPLEANAAALPVVGSNIPGLREAVENGETAILHDVEDLDGMAESALSLLRNSDQALKLGQAGRDRACKLFSVESSMQRWLQIYSECVDRFQYSGCVHDYHCRGFRNISGGRY